MRIAPALLAALGLALMPATVQAKGPAKAAAARDWTRTVTATAEGGFRMGNPAARVKLIEYGSLACPHCRHFDETGYRPLLDGYVRRGKVSYEFRNIVINGPDVAVTLLTRCSGPGKFFAMAQAVYSTQADWEKKISDMVAADKATLDGLTDQQLFARYADVGGFIALAGRFGVTPTRASQCLSDPKGLDRLMGITRAANDVGINRTPTFVINGKVVDGSTWEELEPALKAAGG